MKLVRHASNVYQIFLEGHNTITKETYILHYEIIIEQEGKSLRFYQSVFDPIPTAAEKFTLHTAQKDQYLVIRNHGETTAKALRLCNLNEYFIARKNICIGCPADKFPR